MSYRTLSTLAFILFFCHSWSQEHFPGGVPGAEAWYIVDHAETPLAVYPNHGNPYIRFQPCPDNAMANYLFNFNHSVKATHLCITYTAPLENTTSRNVFFVGEPSPITPNYSHLTTSWRAGIPNLLPTDTVINRFDMANRSTYVNRKVSNYQSVNNANVNFYNWNIYQKEKAIKSYGMQGETSFYIGKGFTTSQPHGEYFSGNFPEFISYPFELTANEKNRVESYLALKYGITLTQNSPYRTAKNVVFWNSLNYIKFGNRVFGIGRDNISGLNQLQSESVHNKDYLIASVGELVATNPIKQELESIGDRHFVVFGDNGQADGLGALNAVNVRPLKRKWLSQNTGEASAQIPLYFKLNLAGAINLAMAADPHLKLWMLHDKYVTNQNISDFTSQYVDYYDAAAMDGLLYGYFYKVFFDPDSAIYDQFTFGVGPQMIVQARFEIGDCDDEKIKTYVVITGGRAPYDINITNTNNYDEDFTINDNILAFEAIAPDTYTINVTDAVGNTGQVVLPVVQQQIAVDFGPDIVLNVNQQQAILNAGQNVLDPTATYQWYFNGELLEHYSPTLTASEPGEYTVIITNGNRMCQVTDTIRIYYNFNGLAEPATACEDESASVAFHVGGGIPPFTVILSGNGQTISQVFNSETFTVTEIDFGQYDIAVSDVNGETFQTSVNLPAPLGGIAVDLMAQVTQQSCTPSMNYAGASPGYLCADSVLLDASLDVTNPNVAYQWYMDGQPVNINIPQVEIYHDYNVQPDLQGFNEFTVSIKNMETGCILSQSIAIARYYNIQANPQGGNFQRVAAPQDAEAGNRSISARVYPNPSPSGKEFYYEISSSEAFEGTVELFTPTGSLLSSQRVSGKSGYTLPFTLLTEGTYIIVTRTNDNTTLTNKIIIR